MSSPSYVFPWERLLLHVTREADLHLAHPVYRLGGWMIWARRLKLEEMKEKPLTDFFSTSAGKIYLTVST